MGLTPLQPPRGAGSSSRQAIGTAVVGGMATATLLAVYFVPVFFVTILRLFKVKRMNEHTEPTPPATGHD
ncbi:MAG: efflux RND transporter permease subunit [Acetobacter papayae]